MSLERPAAVTLKGNPLTLVGPELRTGDKAPDFNVVDLQLKPVTLADTSGKVRIFSVVPSLDTPVCDTQTRRFNQEAYKLEGTQVYTVSMDLPFAQNRWCTTAGVSSVKMLSDYQQASFGQNYGTLIKELRLNSRAIFVIDEEDTLRYAEYVGEVGDHPDYEVALAAVRSVLGG